MTTKCPNCGNTHLAYCRECGRSFPFGTTSICLFEPEHTENVCRVLHCASCGAEVDKEGVIVDDRLILFPFVLRIRKFKPEIRHDEEGD